MAIIKNSQPLSARKLFDLLKTDFADDINAQLGSTLSIAYAHVFDEINISFPEVTYRCGIDHYPAGYGKRL
jgi:hypothetical protein